MAATLTEALEQNIKQSEKTFAAGDAPAKKNVDKSKIDPTKDARNLYTTPEQRKAFEVLYEENKVWVRRKSMDRTLHRIGNVHPQHLGAQEADELTVQWNPKTGEELEAFNCIDICTVYRFKEEKADMLVKGELKQAIKKVTLSDFRMPAWKFLEEFQERI